VELVHEARCAATFYADAIARAKSSQSRNGDIFIVADVGGGTGDFAIFRIGNEAGAQAELRQIGRATST